MGLGELSAEISSLQQVAAKGQGPGLLKHQKLQLHIKDNAIGKSITGAYLIQCDERENHIMYA